MTQVYTAQSTWKNRRGICASSMSINCSTSAPWGRTTNLCGLLKANVPSRTLYSKIVRQQMNWIPFSTLRLDPKCYTPITPTICCIYSLLFLLYYYQCTYHMTVHAYMTRTSTISWRLLNILNPREEDRSEWEEHVTREENPKLDLSSLLAERAQSLH